MWSVKIVPSHLCCRASVAEAGDSEMRPCVFGRKSCVSAYDVDVTSIKHHTGSIITAAKHTWRRFIWSLRIFFYRYNSHIHNRLPILLRKVIRTNLKVETFNRSFQYLEIQFHAENQPSMYLLQGHSVRCSLLRMSSLFVSTSSLTEVRTTSRSLASDTLMVTNIQQ